MGTKAQVPDSTLLASRRKLRTARWIDLEPVTQFIFEVCLSDGNAVIAATAEELRTSWETPPSCMESDAWVVTADDHRVVGYDELVNRYARASLRGDGCVHPDFMGKGIGTALLRVLEERARQEIELADPEYRVFLRNGMSVDSAVAREMHESELYQPIRFFWRMEITLDGIPPVQKGSKCAHSRWISMHIRPISPTKKQNIRGRTCK